MTLVLIAAMALSFGVQDYVEGSVITVVIIVNVIVGFSQVRLPFLACMRQTHRYNAFLHP